MWRLKSKTNNDNLNTDSGKEYLTMSTLELNDISYKYNNAQTRAVSNAACKFEPGHLYAIVGPSGSGKSTLLSMLAGLDLPTDGEIHYDGESLTKLDLDRYRRESVTMIFQQFQLFPLFTITENVCFPMELQGVQPRDAKVKAEKLLESVGITKEQFKRFPSKLSGGEQQRVAIARSLATGAKILLADEPTGNLDVANTEKIMAILSKLARDKGYCVIVVTHDMDVANAADIVYQMRDGQLKEVSRLAGV
ncbi:MAG: ABC transporter ATP-binding protein [Oscillospiraceae bacterium]|nr:ABC transporter ATP-binding protein [Oscillospiraceae bacterium]